MTPCAHVAANRLQNERAALEGAHARRATSGGLFEEGTASLSISAQRAAAAALRRRRGSSDSGSEDGGDAGAVGSARAGGGAAASAAAAAPRGDGGGSDGDGEEDEDAFMRRYRAARVLQLRAGIGLPRYGDVVELVDRLELPDALDAGERGPTTCRCCSAAACSSPPSCGLSCSGPAGARARAAVGAVPASGAGGEGGVAHGGRRVSPHALLCDAIGPRVGVV